MDPKIISLDIESYGACETNHQGTFLPEQKVFNPLRSMHTDKVSLEDLVLTVAITLPEFDPRWTHQSSLSSVKQCNNTNSSLNNEQTKPSNKSEPYLSTQKRQASSSKETSWTCAMLSNLFPSTTMVFQMWKEYDRHCLRKWILHSDTILGMNLLFDIQYLRQLPDFRFVLDGKHTLIDLSVVNYLHSELRPEKSLKSLGPVLGTHTYQQTLKEGRFRNPTDSGIISYNAQDTHNTMMCVSELSIRILKEQECHQNSQKNSSVTSDSSSVLTGTSTKSPTVSLPNASNKYSSTPPSGLSPSKVHTPSSTSCLQPRLTPTVSQQTSSQSSPSKFTQTKILETLSKTKSSKLSPSSVQHYSDTMWACIRMSEAGIPMSLPRLHKLLDLLQLKCRLASKLALSKFDLILEGTGSAKSKQEFLDTLITEIEDSTYTDILNHPLLSLTPKTKKISWSEDNRNLLSSYLPTDHPLQQAVKLVKYHASAQKLISTYLFPLLFHRRNRPEDKSSILIPFSPQIGLAHPQWYIVPSLPKDTGSEGGTIQGRITCKSPSAQTFPPLIKGAMESRWTNGVILGFDLSQIELRVAALLSGDSKLIQSFTEGLDLHTDRTLSVFGDDIQQEPDFKSKWRQIGKTLNFADLFLASASRMQRTVVEMCGDLMPLPFFDNIVKTRFDQRPGLCKWQYELASIAERFGTLVLPITGQSRTFTSFQVDHNKWAKDRIVSSVYTKDHKSLLNEVVNFPIQTTAGNVLLQIQHHLHKALGSMNKVGRRPMMFLQVYDSVYFDCPEDQVDNLKEVIEESVNHVVSSSGYWGHLQQCFNREVPILYEVD